MARSDGEKSGDIQKRDKPAKDGSPADNAQQQKAITDDAKLRSDWEGMTPKPDQESDDVAAPGKLPESKPTDD